MSYWTWENYWPACLRCEPHEGTFGYQRPEWPEDVVERSVTALWMIR